MSDREPVSGDPRGSQRGRLPTLAEHARFLAFITHRERGFEEGSRR